MTSFDPKPRFLAQNLTFPEIQLTPLYLSTADERMSWRKATLPDDQLCIENATMLKRYNRYPLIIDPSGQATQFLLKMYAHERIVQTSFLDEAFRKNLESAIRFGQPLLIQDVEHYDPILNPVLNYEVRKTGGRTLITIAQCEETFKIRGL